MRTKSFIFSAVLSVLLSCGFVTAAEKGNPETQLQELITKIRESLQQGKTSEEALAEQIKEFDLLLEEHKGKKTDEVAQILLAKASLYLQVFNDTKAGLAMIKQLKTDFPDTTQAKSVDQMIAGIEKEEAAKKIQQSMVVGAKFPDFKEIGLDGASLSVADYNGKVVLVDFWATWCGPCVSELPNVLATYEEFHPKGFEILGISLDSDEQALKTFMERRKVTWRQFYDGKGWQNMLAERYGIRSIPATFLLDGEGKIVAKDLRGPALRAEVAKLLKE